MIITPQLVERPNFPTTRYIELMDSTPIFPTDSPSHKNWKLYQLHAFLLVVNSRIHTLPVELMKKVVAVIRNFIEVFLTNITNPAKSLTHTYETDQQDHEEPMDVETSGKVCF